VTVKVGDILRDKYRIDALIGRGGMGQVFSATNLESTHREQVAIKVVSRLLVDEVLMARLHREAEAAARIRSDFVPRVIEVSDTDEGETFLVMERLVGEPLSQRIRDHGALPWQEVNRIGEDVLRGLIDAHIAGIIHRDLKPSNVFLALKAGRVRAMVLDFGVCKMDGVDAERLTGTGESIGTVAYMAPEQIRGAARVDERADLYAFGVLVFEMLCGRLPHDGPSQMAILASKLENPPARLRDFARVPVPDGTDELIAKTLARDPADRFASAQELLKAWRRLSKADSLAPSSTPPPPILSSSDVLGGGEDAPTVRALDPPVVPGPAPLPYEERVIHAAYAPLSSGSLPPPLEPYATQTSLTTHHHSMRRAGGGARVALVLALFGLVAGLVVVGVSFTRDPGAPARTSAGATAPVVATPPPSLAETSEPPQVDVSEVSEDFELLDDTPAEPNRSEPLPVSHATKPRHVRRPRPASTTAPKSSGPRITSQPRY
jgi:serine/threonine-protein kinase